MAIVKQQTEHGLIVYDDEYENCERFAWDFAIEGGQPTLWLRRVAEVKNSDKAKVIVVGEHGLIVVAIHPNRVVAENSVKDYELIMPVDRFTALLAAWERATEPGG